MKRKITSRPEACVQPSAGGEKRIIGARLGLLAAGLLTLTAALLIGAQGVQAAALAVVSSNVELTSTPVPGASPVMRLGYAVAGDSPPLLYLPSADGCSIAHGAGDGGSQVPSRGGGCWLAGAMATADVRDWGASISANDNASAINAAVAYAAASGPKDVTLAPGVEKIASPIRIFGPQAGHLRLHGPGDAQSAYLKLANGSQDGVTIISDASVSLENFTIVAAPGASSGNCVELSGLALENTGSSIQNLNTTNCWTAIRTNAAQEWIIRNANLASNSNAGIIVENSYNEDHGDSTIADTYISNSTASAATGIIQNSGGGLKLSNTKIIGPPSSTCYELALNAKSGTSDLLVSNVSCENMKNGFLLSTKSPAATFLNVQLTGVEFENVLYPVQVVDAGTPWLRGLTITGGTMSVASGGVGMAVGNAQDVAISGEVISCSLAPCTGISAGSKARGFALLYDRATTPWPALPGGFVALNLVDGVLRASQWPQVCGEGSQGVIRNNDGVIVVCPR